MLRFSLEEARNPLAGYAFATYHIPPPRRLNSYGLGAVSLERPWFAYFSGRLASREFWSVLVGELQDPSEGGPGWHKHKAWEALVRVPDIGFTITHKILHHKWPSLFPLLDRVTVPHLGKNQWTRIHRDLTSSANAFAKLEAWFETEALRSDVSGPTDLPIKRLRIHDILLWSRAREKAEMAIKKGSSIRSNYHF
jgi:Family of unknown function (DUF6308)